MKRTYRKTSLFDAKRLGQFCFALFIAYIAFKILTPPSDETVRTTAPDGSKTARLRTFYYLDNQPSYKIDCHETGKPAWLPLYHLPAYTNSPPELHHPDLQWSTTSDRIDFLLNGTSVWNHVFPEK
ncbi:hypothetical protein P4E94_05080 [Pontiellaceae bacterium B12219]|nr:hypothetical protein [Pontiellaceae bacterium B12219]